MYKRTLIAPLVIELALVAGASIAILFSSRHPSKVRTVDPPGLLREVQELSELVSVKCSV